jgi:U2-associated protein SR140
MDACSEADPFNVGRRLMMRWGKNVKKAADGIPVVRKGTGGIAPMIETKTDIENHRAAAALEALLNVDNQRSIRVVPPQDKQRAHFISTVASFVAKDGEQFERMLIHEELSNTDLKFLALSSDANETTKQENVFYKWRVYSFCQGDGFHTWRTEPFTMFQPNGCSWIPPPLDVEAARKEVEESKRKEEEIRKQKQQRRFQSAKRGLTTGRQLEQARRGAADAGARLTDHELTEFDRLFKQTLCASRESICQAMAFCFEKSGAAKQVASMLNDLLLQTAPGTSAETMTARLYLISDVLFNSQQPGIRNAFMYRDAIERMSPDVFRSMGEFARDNFGRMSRERLASAISAILAAWTNWGVYDPAFLDELQAGFEGREIVARKVEETANDMIDTDMIDTDMIEPEYKMGHATTDSTNASAITETPIGDWTTVAADLHEPWEDGNLADGDPEVPIDDDTDGEPLDDVQASEALQVHEDGAPLEDADDADGEPLDDASVESHSSQIPISTKLLGDANGVPLGDDADGEPLEDGPDDDPFDEDPGSVRDEDGEALDDPDGEPLEEELDGGVLQHD